MALKFVQFYLEECDPTNYGPWNSNLPYGKYSANVFRHMVQERNQHLSVEEYINECATSCKLFEVLAKAANELERGDFLILTFHGHATRLLWPRAKGCWDFDCDWECPPPDGEREYLEWPMAPQSETATTETGDCPKPQPRPQQRPPHVEGWCMYDRVVWDFELTKILTCFKRGVRILIVSDSCYSSTMIEDDKDSLTRRDSWAERFFNCYAPHIYKPLLNLKPKLNLNIRASVILLAASRDDERAGYMSMNKPSTFIWKLKKTWEPGNQSLTYFQWIKRARQFEKGAKPHYSRHGNSNNQFEHGPIF